MSGFTDSTTIYALREMDGTPFPAKATLQFPAPGDVQGDGPCNRFRAAQTLPYPWLAISDILATKRACPALDAEAHYFEALQDMTLVEAQGTVLILSNDAGREMVFYALD